MPGGNASHKGSSIKPNTNAEGSMDTAADVPAIDPQEIAPPKGADELRAMEAPENEQATERPQSEQS